VQVVAPETVQSATGHGITLSGPLMTTPTTVEGLFTGTAVAGRPADCVKLALTQLMDRKPDLVVSGLNSGANVGINVIYSGTVAAALEAAYLGYPAVAASLYLKNIAPDYPKAAALARQTIEKILAAGLKKGQVMTVNIPALRPEESPAGLKVARQCTRGYDDVYERRKDPKGRDYFWNTSVFRLDNTEADTDVAALRQGYITVTPLQYDLTDYKLMGEYGEKLK
jgi:5'-nucleotidase